MQINVEDDPDGPNGSSSAASSLLVDSTDHISSASINDDNPDNAVNRFEWLEAMLRVALSRYAHCLVGDWEDSDDSTIDSSTSTSTSTSDKRQASPRQAPPVKRTVLEAYPWTSADRGTGERCPFFAVADLPPSAVAEKISFPLAVELTIMEVCIE